MVRADGVVAKSGGKVVKNVAGYDLGKLLTGSSAPSAVLTEVAFRLHPRAADAQRWVTRAGGRRRRGATRSSSAVVHSQLVPDGGRARPARRRAGATVAVLLEGIAAGVEGRTSRALALLGAGGRRGRHRAGLVGDRAVRSAATWR